MPPGRVVVAGPATGGDFLAEVSELLVDRVDRLLCSY